MEKNNINNVLSAQQLDRIFKYIITKYDDCRVYSQTGSLSELVDMKTLDVGFTQEICVIHIFACYDQGLAYSFDGYSSYMDDDDRFILVNRQGEIIGDYPKVRYVTDGLIVFQEDSELDVWSVGSFPCSTFCYDKRPKQGIILTNGDVLYRGDLGDIDDIEFKTSVDGAFLLLKRKKFTYIEKLKIEYYLEYHTYDDNFDDVDDEYINNNDANYDNNYEKLTYDQLLRADNYNEILKWKANSVQELESFENFIKLKESDDFLEEIYPWCEDKEVDRYHIEGEVYALFSIAKKKIIIPFQPCIISINTVYPSGIYLKKERERSGIKFSRKSAPLKHYSTIEFNCSVYSGDIITSICDTFRSGRYVGMTLYQAFNKNPIAVIRLVHEGHLFITTEALSQLKQIYKKKRKKAINSLIAARDCMMTLYDDHDIIIDSCEQRIYGMAVIANEEYATECLFYEGWTIKDIFQTNPQYLTTLFSFQYGLNVKLSVLDGLDEMSPNFQNLKDIIQCNIVEKEAEESRRIAAAEYSMWRDEIEDAYRAAFDYNPDAEWNID